MKMFNKKSIFDKIDTYLVKKGHRLVMSVFLMNFNGNNIYIRFDYVAKLAVYKVVWVDLNFFNEKHMDDYLNMQMMTNFLATKLIDGMSKKEHENNYSFNDRIFDDRVEVLSYFFDTPHEYVFDRYLPLDCEFLIDPLVMIFSYLPKSMMVFLNEMFAKFDKLEEQYTVRKKVLFDIYKDEPTIFFRDYMIKEGERLYKQESVHYLEKINNEYTSIVEDKVPYLVSITDYGDNKYLFWCNCKNKVFCKHMYATILAIKNKNYHPFYKVRYVGKDETLLEKVTIGNFYLCFGIQNDKLLIIAREGIIFPADIIQKGKCVFEVIEDDDDCSLSKALNEYKMK